MLNLLFTASALIALYLRPTSSVYSRRPRPVQYEQVPGCGSTRACCQYLNPDILEIYVKSFACFIVSDTIFYSCVIEAFMLDGISSPQRTSETYQINCDLEAELAWCYASDEYSPETVFASQHERREGQCVPRRVFISELINADDIQYCLDKWHRMAGSLSGQLSSNWPGREFREREQSAEDQGPASRQRTTQMGSWNVLGRTRHEDGRPFMAESLSLGI